MVASIVSTVPSLRAIARIVATSLALGLPAAGSDEVEALRRQVEGQSELIRQQAEALARQSAEMEQMGDRLRALEDERTVAPQTALAAPATGAVPGDPREHRPGSGFALAETEWGSFGARLYSYVRYLNQRGLDGHYTDSFGRTSAIDRRNDLQLNKVTLYNFGWLLDPKLRYLFYVWSANTSQGLGAQVVVAGNLQYEFADWLTLGGGIGSLPGTRSTSGNFPFWLGVDNRMIADEFFRPSYTTGVWAKGELLPGVDYQVMLGNNLSQLGVDAGQLDGKLNTVSAALTWEPLGAYGRGFGDFERHEDPAALLGARFTFSHEDAQGQPDTEDFENVQIRLSDGNVIFQPGLFAPGTQVRDANYQMLAVDSGVKYKGFSLEGEYYYRWLNEFAVRGASGLPFDHLRDHGFQLQASAMVVPETLQVYVSGSKIFGEYGNPWDARIGANWFPFENLGIRINNELIRVEQSPVGALSLPYLVGADGLIFYSNFEVFF